MLIDRNTYTKPSLPVLGAANTKITDPTFGSRILRVSDPNILSTPNLSYGTPSASYQLSWSKLATKFYVKSSSSTVIPFAFDSVNMLRSRISGAGDGGLVISTVSTEPQFSYVDDNIIYVTGQNGTHSTPIIQKYNFLTATYTDLLDLYNTLTPLGVTIPDASYCPNIFSSELAPEKIVCMCPTQVGDDNCYAIVFEVGTPTNHKVVDTLNSRVSTNGAAFVPTNITLGFHMHGVDIDRTGRFVCLFTAAADLGTHAKKYIWDTLLNTFTAMNVLADAHTVMGWGDFINMACCTSSSYDNLQMQYRSLLAIDTTRDVLRDMPVPSEIYVDGHGSWHNALVSGLQPLFREVYRAQDGPFDSPKNLTPWRVWDDEIIAVKTDGIESTTTVYRFCHHRSIPRDDVDTAGVQPFYYQPRPCVSPDGLWCLFTSNWDRTLGTDPNPQSATATKRYDTFIVETALVVAPPPPPPSVGSLGLRRWDLD